MTLKKIPFPFYLAFCLCWGSFLEADIVIRQRGEEREELKGTIQRENWDRVEIQVEGSRVSVNADEIYSVTRENLPSALATAQGEAAAATTEAAIKAADSALKAAGDRGRQPWEKEYAAWFRFRLWMDHGKAAEARKVLDDLAEANRESRFLPKAWIEWAQQAHGAGDAARVKEAADKLRAMGSLGRVSSSYFEALGLLAAGDSQGVGKMNLAYRGLQAQSSVAGRRLLVSAAWYHGRNLADKKDSVALKELVESLEGFYEGFDGRGRGLTRCLEGDLLRIQDKDAEALYAYMRVVVQYPQLADAHAHALDWAEALSRKLNYTEDAKKLAEELARRHGDYKRQAP